MSKGTLQGTSTYFDWRLRPAPKKRGRRQLYAYCTSKQCLLAAYKDQGLAEYLKESEIPDEFFIPKETRKNSCPDCGCQIFWSRTQKVGRSKR